MGFESFAVTHHRGRCSSGDVARLGYVQHGSCGRPSAVLTQRPAESLVRFSSIHNLWESVKPNQAQPVVPKAARKAKGGAQAAQGAPTKGKATKKATPPRTRPRANCRQDAGSHRTPRR
jgi:hypothetical protein